MNIPRAIDKYFSWLTLGIYTRLKLTYLETPFRVATAPIMAALTKRCSNSLVMSRTSNSISMVPSLSKMLELQGKPNIEIMRNLKADAIEGIEALPPGSYATAVNELFYRAVVKHPPRNQFCEKPLFICCPSAYRQFIINIRIIIKGEIKCRSLLY